MNATIAPDFEDEAPTIPIPRETLDAVRQRWQAKQEEEGPMCMNSERPTRDVLTAATRARRQGGITK